MWFFCSGLEEHFVKGNYKQTLFQKAIYALAIRNLEYAFKNKSFCASVSGGEDDDYNNNQILDLYLQNTCLNHKCHVT